MADFFTISTYIKYATIPSVVILGILCMLQRRQKPSRCGDRPGIVVLMRFLDGYDNRWAYALSFGAITSILLNVFMQTALTEDASEVLFCGDDNSTTNICNEVWMKSLVLQAQTVVASLVCAPHFACITTPYKLVGAILGFGYSVYWVVFYIVGAVRSEKYYDRTLGTLTIMRDLPIVICFVGLMARSGWACYLCYRAKRLVIQEVDSIVTVHQVKHVQTLLRAEPPTADTLLEEKGRESWKEWLQERLRPTIFPFFKLPTRLVCIACVQVIIIYYLAISLTRVGITVRRLLGNLTQDVPDKSILLKIFDGVYIVAEVMGIASSLIYVLLFVNNYRLNMMRLYKGQKLSIIEDPGSPQQLVARSLRLPGYQLAYIVWGLLVMFGAVLLVTGIIAFGIYALQRFGILMSTLKSLAQTLSVPATTLAIFYVQVLLVRLFLMQPKIHEDDPAPPLNVDNRHVYEVVSYIFVFNNLVVGLASALLRTLKSFILGVIFLGRLDRCLLMKGFESFDPGYMAYVGTLLVDNAHNNPTMRAFCAVLIRLTCKKEKDKEKLGIRCLPEPEKLCSNSRAARRWHLAYTLLHNPDLLPRRKLTLLLTRGLEDGSCGHPINCDKRRKQSWVEMQLGSRSGPAVQWSMSDPGTYGGNELARQTGYPATGDNRNIPEMPYRNGGRSKRDHDEQRRSGYGAVNAVQNPGFVKDVDA